LSTDILYRAAKIALTDKIGLSIVHKKFPTEHTQYPGNKIRGIENEKKQIIFLLMFVSICFVWSYFGSGKSLRRVNEGRAESCFAY
jgi:hypothetical protein